MFKERKKDITNNRVSKGFGEDSSEAREIKASTAYEACAEQLTPFAGLPALTKFEEVFE